MPEGVPLDPFQPALRAAFFSPNQGMRKCEYVLYNPRNGRPIQRRMIRLKISSNRNPSSVNQNGVPVLRTCVEKRSTGKRRSVGDCGLSEDRRS